MSTVIGGNSMSSTLVTHPVSPMRWRLKFSRRRTFGCKPISSSYNNRLRSFTDRQQWATSIQKEMKVILLVSLTSVYCHDSSTMSPTRIHNQTYKSQCKYAQTVALMQGLLRCIDRTPVGHHFVMNPIPGAIFFAAAVVAPIYGIFAQPVSLFADPRWSKAVVPVSRGGVQLMT